VSNTESLLIPPQQGLLKKEGNLRAHRFNKLSAPVECSNTLRCTSKWYEVIVCFGPCHGSGGYVGFVVDKVALGQVFPRVLRFSPVSFIPPVLHYKEKNEKN
jgi:hypothetical protein